MKLVTLVAVAALLSLPACDRKWKYRAKPDYLRTDSAMITHKNPSNSSSTGVGIPGY